MAALIYPKLGDSECHALTADVLRKWHVSLTKESGRAWRTTLREREIAGLLAGVAEAAEAAPSGAMSVDTGVADTARPPREGGQA